ncbi:dTDP-4-dehydrorhamnose reductase [Bacteroidota bacterium]
MKKIIVTGANGQLGSEIRELSKNSAHEFLFIDIEDLDLTVAEDVLQFLGNEQPDYIINCAAYTAVDKAESDRETAYAINAEVPDRLEKYCAGANCRLIHISTDYVFSGEAFSPLSETDPVGPASVYGKSKLAGETALLNNPHCITVRTSWLYSSFGNNFVKSMLRLFNERDELGIVFDQVSTPTYAADLAKVIMHIIDGGDQQFIPGVYHYSNEGLASWYDFAFEILLQSGENCRLTPILTDAYPLPAPRPQYSVLNKEKIKETFSIEIPHWKTSLVHCLEIIKR